MTTFFRILICTAMAYSIILMLFAVDPDLVLLRRFKTYETMYAENAELVNSPSAWKRIPAKLLVSMNNHRLICGFIGLEVFLVTVVFYLQRWN